MSPEQIQGQEVDARSDLFVFGILLYKMLSGGHPWPRPSTVDTLHAILHDDSPPLEMPLGDALSAVVQTLLRKDVSGAVPIGRSGNRSAHYACGRPGCHAELREPETAHVHRRSAVHISQRCGRQ